MQNERWPQSANQFILYSVADSPYRSAVAETRIEANTERGKVILHVAPKYTRIEIGDEHWTVADDHLSLVRQRKRRVKKKSILLKGARLVVAKAWPTHDAGLWIEYRPGVMQRLFGLPPRIGMTEQVMADWKQLEVLTSALAKALTSYSEGASACEIGNGQHRVLALEYEERIVLFARPLFRERPRRLIELRKDGSLVFPVRKKEDRIQPMPNGVRVIASGDRICFCHQDGQQEAGLFLPWIGHAGRKELTRRFQAIVGEAVPRQEGGLLSSAEVSFLVPQAVLGDSTTDK